MIKNIKELQDYLLEDADKFEELMMTSPGCSYKKVEELKKSLPSIPDSYTKWVQSLNLNNICIGSFVISPSSSHKGDMISNLLEGNSNKWQAWDYAQRYHLYYIASNDSYWIYVATASSLFKEGEIIAIDECIYQEKNEDKAKEYIYPIAKDFEQFLLIAGNLYHLSGQFENNQKIKEELVKCLKDLNVSEEYYDAWLNHLMY